MSKPCEKCGGTDFTPSGKCRACQKAANEKYRAKAVGGGSAVKKKKKPAKAKPAARLAVALEIEQGYGVRAVVDDAYLILEQHDGETDSDDKICLSRTEFRALVGKFSEWAA